MVKKRLLSALLAICMSLTLLPTAAFAANEGTEPVLLGSMKDYQTTLDSMYDENGLRVVGVGYAVKAGMEGQKYGIINEYGNWVAQPIYDEIKVDAEDLRLRSYEKGGTAGARTPETPVVFIGGYTQAVRDGKMGLLNTKGEEVIPCQYDYVQMTAEGMAAVYNLREKGNAGANSHKYYLGYWNLEQNREVVKPNKYTTQFKGVPIGRPNMGLGNGYLKESGDYYQIHDFKDGYALVTLDTAKDYVLPANIIDKNGKEILPKNYNIYSEHLFVDVASRYAQHGTYLVIVEEKYQEGYEEFNPNSVRKENEYGQVMYSGNYLAAGVATTTGIIVEPQYCSIGYVRRNDTLYTRQDPLMFSIYPQAKLISAPVPHHGGKLLPNANTFIDFSGKTVLLEGGTFIEESNVIISGGGIYTPAGKLLTSVKGALYVLMANGYTFGYEEGMWTPEDGGYQQTTIYLVGADGSKLNLTNRMGWDLKSANKYYSNVSVNGNLWVANSQGKWGLIDVKGKEILPFVYDDVKHDEWARKELPFAIVTQNGKQGLVDVKGQFLAPCEYDEFYLKDATTSIVATKNGKRGLIDLATGKITLPIKYDGIGGFQALGQLNPDYFALGVCYAKKGQDVVLVDRQGNEVYTRAFVEGRTELNVMNEAVNGLYSVNEGQIDSRGRVIIPKVDREKAGIDYQAATVVYQENDNVYRVNANHTARNYAPKPYAPQTATAAPSATKLMVDGKNVAVDAYAIAGNNYIKLRDLATMVSGTGKNFEVTWDNARAAINLVSGKGYTAVGGEMAKGDGAAKTATRTTSKIFLNGGEVAMTAYAIGGNNYFKLRDVMQTFDVGVGYDNATATATLTTTQSYALTGDALKYQQADQAAYEKAGGKLNADGSVEQTKLYDEPRITCTSTPKKAEYSVGDTFDRTGFKAQYEDVYGNGTDISNQFTFTINGKTIQNGDILTTAGKLKVNCVYQGEVQNYFEITVYEKVDAKNLPLADGDYYIMLQGKYVSPTGTNNWMELSDQKPASAFTVKHLGVDKENGQHLYQLIINNRTVNYYGSGNGAQLYATGGVAFPLEWRIAKYSDFWTVRLGDNQALAVNADGTSSKNGTKVTLWTYKGSAPDHAKLQFIPAK